MDILGALSGRSPQGYEAQLRLPRQRMCGAASLVMAYRRCGLEVDQTSIWRSIAVEHLGDFRAHSYHMAADAIDRGLAASIIQTHQPWKSLEACWRNNIAAIVNYRASEASASGHYALLAGINQDSIRLHDPLAGPAIELGRDLFLKLWLPLSVNSEIAGNVLLAISRKEDEPGIWCHCNRPFEAAIDCQRCGHSISLQPAVALGCWNPECKDRLWYRLFCSQCDFPVHEI